MPGTGGDVTAARHAAAQMLAGYQPETADELRLAAAAVSFGLHALEALSQAATADLSLTKILRLRGSAVSLSRESHKAQRRLEQVQKLRRAVENAAPAEASQQHVEPASALIGAGTQAGGGKANGQSWTQSYQQRQTVRRVSRKLAKQQVCHAAGPPRAADAVSLSG